jgi:hypothetical protein
MLQGPRRCDYNGRLYCHECHRGDATELPAAVLHHWDFHPRPVSTLAADYLASIADRPLLCIGAVNPGANLLACLRIPPPHFAPLPASPCWALCPSTTVRWDAERCQLLASELLLK